MTHTVSASWLLWLSARLTQDSTEELARAAIRATLTHSKLTEQEHSEIQADVDSLDGNLVQSVANLIYQLRPLLLPIGIQVQISRINLRQAEKYHEGAVELEVPWKTLDTLHRTLIRLVEFYGEKGKTYAARLTEDFGQPDPMPNLLREWVPPDEAEPVAFRWPRDAAKMKPGMLDRDSDWQAITVPDPAHCRAMRRFVMSVWARRKELLALQATPEKYPHAVLPVVVLKHMEAWQTHRPEISTEGLVMRNPGGQRDGTFPGLLPEVAARLVDNPGTMAGLTARRLFRLLPRLAWKQAIEGKNPFNRLVFNGLQDLAEKLDIQSKTQIAMVRDILRAGQEWQKGEMHLPPMWQVWMPERMTRGRTVSEIRIDVGEALCPGFVSPKEAQHELRWILPVLALPDLTSIGNNRQTALEALQWSLLMELRQSAAEGAVMGESLRLTNGQRIRAADRAGISCVEMEQALSGHNDSVPWLAPFQEPGDAWMLDCGKEWVQLREAGAQKVLLGAAARADINRSRYRKH